jgi:LasA protease
MMQGLMTVLRALNASGAHGGRPTARPYRICAGFLLFSLLTAATGCIRPMSDSVQPWKINQGTETPQAASHPDAPPVPQATAEVALPTRDPNSPLLSPTPDAPHSLPTQRTNEEQYTVQRGDTLGIISQHFGVDINSIISANNLTNPDILEVGQTLTIPAPQPLPPGPDFKVLPDSELVNGPAAAKFDIAGFIDQKNGYLKYYGEDRDGQRYTGAQIIERVSKEYSVNPRLLLAVLENLSGWVTSQTPDSKHKDFPIGYYQPAYQGLYQQISWAANHLNSGYYLWKVGGVSRWVLADGSLVPPAATLNAATAGVQGFYSLLDDKAAWENAVGEKGLFATYQSLFGYPFAYAVEPLIPAGLQQPTMQLPFEPGAVWSFTGGPHGGFGSGSAWAAIDFAPPGDALGCVENDAWVAASAPGLIIRAENGEVIEDLDGDGYEQTGWTILYMHIATRDRVKVGTKLQPGDKIGHPSCEGGVSNGTHVHFARRYNGEWISADNGKIPFNLEGWISKGNGVEYDGWLVRGDKTVEAWDARKDENQISR